MRLLTKAEILTLKLGDEVLVIEINKPWNYERQTIYSSNYTMLESVCEWGTSKSQLEDYNIGNKEPAELDRYQGINSDFLLRENGTVYCKDFKKSGVPAYVQYAADILSADIIKLDSEDPEIKKKPAKQHN